MDYQQLTSPSVPIALHQAHHNQQQQQPAQQQPPVNVAQIHPHIMVSPAIQQQAQQSPLVSTTNPIHAPLTNVNEDGASSRWTRYQHLWRQHHIYMNGKQPKDGSDDKKDDNELWNNVEAQAAFLGPNLWDKTLPYEADLKYVDLDEFLSENGIPVDGNASTGQCATAPAVAAHHHPHHHHLHQHHQQQQQQHHQKISDNEVTAGSGTAGLQQGPANLHLEAVLKRERSPSPSECCSPDTLNPPSPTDSTLSMASSGRDFDPRIRTFSDEELKPQPIIKKSRKQFVPDDLKDDKYWARRRKNNMAAKRSRDARRMKENQIALRAGFLEKENMGLRQELDRLKIENMTLRDKLSKYKDI